MSADVPQTNPQQQSKLPFILDGLSCVGAIGGTIASLVTQQVMFATVPLSILFSVQVANRYKQHQQVQLALETTTRDVHALEYDSSLQCIEMFNLERLINAKDPLLRTLEYDARLQCIELFSLERLMESKDQEQQYKTEKLSHELSTKFNELDTVVETIRAIVADSQSGSLSSAEVHYNRGVNQEQLGNLEAAIADYTKVIEQEATHAFAFLRRGLAHMESGEKQAALLDLNAAAKHFFAEGDLQNYEIAKEKANAIHAAEAAAKQIHSVKMDKAIPASINTLFGS